MTLLQDVNTTQDANAKTSLSFTEILNLYLWGQTDGMADKVSEAIPHMRARNELTLNISMQSFMNECASIINIFNAGDGEDSISDSSASDSPAHNIVLMGEGLRAEDALVGR